MSCFACLRVDWDLGTLPVNVRASRKPSLSSIRQCRKAESKGSSFFAEKSTVNIGLTLLSIILPPICVRRTRTLSLLFCPNHTEPNLIRILATGTAILDRQTPTHGPNPARTDLQHPGDPRHREAQLARTTQTATSRPLRTQESAAITSATVLDQSVEPNALARPPLVTNCFAPAAAIGKRLIFGTSSTRFYT